MVLGFNVQHFQWFSLFPPGSNTVGEVVQNGVVLSANTAEITIFWCWRIGWSSAGVVLVPFMALWGVRT